MKAIFNRYRIDFGVYHILHKYPPHLWVNWTGKKLIINNELGDLMMYMNYLFNSMRQ